MSDRSGKVFLTRHRWNAYFLPLFLAAAVIGVIRVYQTGQLRFALLPIATIPIWLTIRWTTPREGMWASSARQVPTLFLMLAFSVAAIFAMAVVLLIDIQLLGHPFNAPLEPYHALLFSPPFVILFTGAFLADRSSRKRSQNSTPTTSVPSKQVSAD